MKFDRIYERILFDTMVCENILLISVIQILVYSTNINAPQKWHAILVPICITFF